ncbi:MBL fold metallo-hydrolase [Ignisphaera sp. 4213-co]|uniref:Ribonuclease Z n=1 Tax=Ignisphaera cupida TaxID=3050454 RepID=A0ABD4Z3G5_9CREN|nr:MBL fold metallo-hydrolase [Ignisphaera sp. 4213-co]MDK6027861.1 MBL fold metallo-hydrolase [Ignisphaera sp. 4213-co]
MKLVFLGTGATAPSRDRFLPGILLCSVKECMLLDCGEGTQIQLLKAGIDLVKIRCVVITHLHGDHFYGIYPLIDSFVMRVKTQGLRDKSLAIYAPRGFCSTFNSAYFSDIVKCFEFSKSSSTGNEFVEVGEFKFTWLPMSHGDVEAYGIFVVIKNRDREIKLFYSGDGVCRDECVEFLKTVKPCIIIHESSFLDYKDDAKKAMERFHATTAEAANLAKNVNAKILVLTHISSRYRDDDLKDFISRAKRIFNGDVYIASDLSLIQLDRVLC